MVSGCCESLDRLPLIECKHWRSLFMSEEPSKKYLGLESRMEQASPVTFEPAKKLRAFFHGVTKLRARIKNFTGVYTKRRELERFEIINSYLKVAERLERKMQDWCDVLEWQPQEAIQGAESPVLDGAYASSTFYNYNALFLWNRYLVAKVALHAGLLDALQLLPEHNSSYDEGATVYPNFVEVKKWHKEALQDTADRFIGAIAYAFGDIDPADSSPDHDGGQARIRRQKAPRHQYLRSPSSVSATCVLFCISYTLLKRNGMLSRRLYTELPWISTR